jgi:hypothetical protein
LTPEQRLHDRATRGEILSAEEQAQLDAWYSALEHDEMQVLFGRGGSSQPEVGSGISSLVQLQQQIDTLLVQIATTTVRIQELSEQNKHLRNEVSKVRRKVAEHIALDVA